mmetsp:Transcript_25709/g.59973  ORF Transcript_25709/g.59973 Transcript_25709/m.59973 type:complete len:154 (+) Transcript_25709:97-558(+)
MTEAAASASSSSAKAADTYVSPRSIAVSFLSSPMSLFMVASALYAMSSEGMTVVSAAVAGFVIVGLGLGSFLVSMVENSEWRKELRRKVAAKEREMGVTYKDKATAAYHMGMPMPPRADNEPIDDDDDAPVEDEKEEESAPADPKPAEEKKDD